MSDGTPSTLTARDWLVSLCVALSLFVAACSGEQAVKTVNVERTSTTTVAIPKATVCPKPDEMPVLPSVVVAPEGAATDQLAAASAANAEAFARYSMAVAAMFKRCAEGVSK